MKTLVLQGVEQIGWEDRPVPALGADMALVKVEAVSVCGSDIHAYKGANALLTYPRVLGHEVCGSIEAVSAGGEFAKGDLVILMPYLNCGSCIACRKGKRNCCASLSVYGVHRDGAMAEYVEVPTSHLLKLPAGITPEAAAVIEPLAISAHAVWRAQVQPGETVLVAGAGPIGLGAAEVAKTYGARVLIADTDVKRRNFVKERFGYDSPLDPMAPDYREHLAELTGGEFPDKIIDSTGNNRSMEANILNLCQGGRMVYVGIWQGELCFKHIDFHKREAELLGSRGARKEDFQYVIDCMAQKKLFPERFITHQAPFSEAKEAFEGWIAKGGEVFKAVLRM